MRKSRRQNKRKIGKRFSRKKILDSRIKNLKGGSFNDEDNLILIGYANKSFTPIIVPINSTWDSKPAPQGFNGILMTPGISNIVANDHSPNIILSQLYKLPNIRNMDLFQDFASRAVNGSFVDNTDTAVLPFKGYTPGNIDKEEYYKYFKPQIIEIERKYPGLFKPIFLTPEETQQAINNLPIEPPIKEVQMEERIGDRLTNAVSDIVDIIKHRVIQSDNNTQDSISSLAEQLKRLEMRINEQT